MNHLAYIDDLQRVNSEFVSFYPKIALERGIDQGLVDVGFENGDPCGYIYRTRPGIGKVLRIWQAVIDYDLRRQRVGTEMISRYIEQARASGAAAIELRCRSSIPANAFWQALGFTCVNVGQGGLKRAADINTWRLDLWPSLFSTSLEPSTKSDDQRAYRTLKQTGFVFPSRFSR